MADTTDNPATIENPVAAGTPAKEVKPVKAREPAKAQKPAKPDKTAKSKESAKKVKATKTAKAAKQKNVKPEKPAKPQKGATPEKAAKPAKSAKPGKAAKRQKAEKAQKAAKPAGAPLHTASCKPRKGAEHRLDADEVEQFLELLPGWELIDAGEAIAKIYTFKNYYRTLAFVNALAYIAHNEDHHPDLGVHYGKVVVRYSTHDVGGLSMNDFICAAKVELLPS